MSDRLRAEIELDLGSRRDSGRYIEEVVLDGGQGPHVRLADGSVVLNLCSNDYLGLAADPITAAVADEATRTFGFGMASGRIISGTTTAHKALERQLSAFLRVDDALLFTSCFDANGALFGALTTASDAIISDELNHASIIDGIRLSKAERFSFRNADLAHLAAILEECRSHRRRVIVTDGVFSMDGTCADLASICDLAELHDALLVVDDSHATGVLGPRGAGTVGAADVATRVDLVTGTFGKALGGAGGGFIAGRGPLIELLRQAARPYLFSNSLSPAVVAVASHALTALTTQDGPRRQLRDRTVLMRTELQRRGLQVGSGDHPIIPVLIGDEKRTKAIAAELRRRGVLVVALTYPVVGRGSARLRVQVTASHAKDDLRAAAQLITDAVSQFS